MYICLHAYLFYTKTYVSIPIDCFNYLHKLESGFIIEREQEEGTKYYK